jgi:hypothetical protein
MRIRRTLFLRLFVRLLPVLALAAALPWTFAYWIDRGWVVAVSSTVILLTLAWWSLRRAGPAQLAVPCAGWQHQHLSRWRVQLRRALAQPR